MSERPEDTRHEPSDEEYREGAAAWRESGLADALGAYATPEASADFSDETMLRLMLHRHDPGQRADAAGTAFTDRVMHALDEEPLSERATPADLDRAPATVELRSHRAPYLIAAAILLATTVALMWPKGPGPTAPKIRAVAAQLQEGLRAVSDPATAASGLVRTLDFTKSSDEDLYEIPRFSPPSLAEFQAADLATRAVDASGSETR